MISKGNRSYGLEVYLKEDGTPEYSFCALERSGEEISVVESAMGITDFQEVKKKLKSDYPVTVVVAGKGILAKSSGDLQNPAFQDLFPGINQQDFYFVSIQNQGFVARKKAIETIADSLLVIKLSVVGLSLGYATLYHSLQLLEDQVNCSEFILRGQTIRLSGEKGVLSGNEIQIGNETIAVSLLPAYCAALAHFTQTGSNLNIDYQPLVNAGKEFVSYQRMVKQILAFAAIMLTIIAISSGLSYYYTGLTEQLNQGNYVSGIGGSRDSLIAEIKAKKKFLLDEDWVSASKVSFYADRLAAGVLKGISFNSLKVSPIKKNSSLEEVVFEAKKMEVKGKSNSELTLKNWTENLKKETWVENAELTAYEWNNKTGNGEFALLITLND